MNEELSAALAALIEKTLAGIDTAVGFGAEQLPDVIQQLLAWNLAMNIFNASWTLIAVAILLIANAKAWRSRPEPSGTSNLFWRVWRDGDVTADNIIPLWLISALAVPGLSIVSGLSFLGALQITIAPKVWLLEYAAGLVK